MTIFPKWLADRFAALRSEAPDVTLNLRITDAAELRRFILEHPDAVKRALRRVARRGARA